MRRWVPGHRLLQRAGSGQGAHIFFTCFCSGPSFQSEYLDTFYKVVSMKKKKKTKKTNTCSFALGFSLNQMNPWCMKRLSGRRREAECWCKAGICCFTPQCEVCAPGGSKAWLDKRGHCEVPTIDKQEDLAGMKKSHPL